MIQFLSNLDNREIAVGFWLVVALALVFRKSKVRRSFASVGRALLAKPILIGITLMIVYVTVEVTVLSLLGIWALSQLKATIIWGVTVAAIMLFSVNKVHQDERFFRKAVKENFKLAVLIDFFVNLHVLPLVGELFIVPIATLAGVMLAVAETDEKYAPVRKLLTGFLGILGLSMLAYALWKVSQNLDSLAEVETLRSLAVPIALSLLYLPFIYFVVVYMAYENVFVRL